MGGLILSSTPVSVKKSKEEGEKDLAALAATADMVGVFIFSLQDSMWYNPGYRPLAEGESEKAFIGIEDSAVDHAKYGGRTIVYHVHPKLFEKEDYDIKVNRAIERGIHDVLNDDDWLGLKSYFGNICAARTTLPYEQDIIAFLDVLERSTNEEVGYRIVSEHGILTVEMGWKKPTVPGSQPPPEFWPGGKVPERLKNVFDVTLDLGQDKIEEYKVNTLVRYVDQLLGDVMIEKGNELFGGVSVREGIDNAIDLINTYMEGRMKLSMQSLG